MVVDPVCRMTIDPDTAAAREVFERQASVFLLGKAAAVASWLALPPMRRRLLRRRWVANLRMLFGHGRP